MKITSSYQEVRVQLARVRVIGSQLYFLNLNTNVAPRRSGQNCKLFKYRLSQNSQKRLGYKENNTK